MNDERADRPASSVVLTKVRGGQRTWRVSVVARDDTAESVREAVAFARQIDADLDAAYARFDPPPSRQGRRAPDHEPEGGDAA
jgi:hypothetical protein